MHNFHIWYHEGRVLEGQERAVDYCLSLPPRIDSACIDVDAVDVLIHGWRLLDYRRADIEAWLAALLPELLAFQNRDGGFCDVREGVRRQDGWVKGYAERRGFRTPLPPGSAGSRLHDRGCALARPLALEISGA